MQSNTNEAALVLSKCTKIKFTDSTVKYKSFKQFAKSDFRSN